MSFRISLLLSQLFGDERNQAKRHERRVKYDRILCHAPSCNKFHSWKL